MIQVGGADPVVDALHHPLRHAHGSARGSGAPSRAMRRRILSKLTASRRPSRLITCMRVAVSFEKEGDTH